MTDKILTLLGFASKSGNISFGMDSFKDKARSKKSRLAVAASDISEKSLKEVKFYCNKYNIKLLILKSDILTLSHAVGKKCGIVSVNDRNFAESIIALALQNEREAEI